MSIIGCISHVPTEKTECFRKNFIITETKSISSVRDNKTGVPTENVKLNLAQNEDVCDNYSKQLIHFALIKSKNFNSSNQMHKEKMKPESDEILSPSPVTAEVVNYITTTVCAETDPGSLSLKIPDPCSTTTEIVSNADLSANASCTKDSSPSPSASSSSDSPKKKKRYLFLFKPSLSKILVKTKGGGDSYKCFTCGGIYRQKFSLKRHFLRTHIDYRYISEADIANCKIPAPSYFSQQMNADCKKTSNGRKKFKKSSNDVFLENNDTGLLPGLYRCHDCTNMSFDSDAELREHYNNHPDSIKKKYQCDICDASFIKKQILSRHLAGHVGKKVTIACKKCDLEFSSNLELEKHLASHSSGKMCKYCNKLLSSSANRIRHERLHEKGGFRCTSCLKFFAERKDLNEHIESYHNDSRHTCSQCKYVCPTQEILDAHIQEKHSSLPEVPENVSPPAKKKPLPNPKAKACFVCKRVFPTVYAMLKHKQNAHPFHSRRKRHKKRQKTEASGNDSEYRRTHIKPGRPRSSDTGNQAKQNGNNGVRFLSKRERLYYERTRKEEEEFYNKVHENIAYNLTHCIEGQASQLKLKQYNFSESQHAYDHSHERGCYPWTHYNFPPYYDVDHALEMKGYEIKRPENLSVADEFLHEAAGLTPVPSRVNNRNENNASAVATNDNQREKLTLEERKKLIGKEIISVFVCHVCRESLDSYNAFTAHCVNNHPNIDCSYTEIVGDNESPPVIPAEMCRIRLSPNGVRFACDVPPPAAVEEIVSCTKCRAQFQSREELHIHIAACGNLKTYTKKHSLKFPTDVSSMKNRMTLAQQRSSYMENGYKTPEKRQTSFSKLSRSLGDRSSKSEKLSFYKNGRLQTKSLTVNKNYFNTKPTKPVKSGSKRGRKSYEEKSMAYRHATMQPSTSRECSGCNVVFSSIQQLNNHQKSPCARSFEQFNERYKMLNHKSELENNSFANDATDKKKVSEVINVSHLKVSPAIKFPSFHANVSSSESKSPSHFKDFHAGKTARQISVNLRRPDIPMDLSRNSNDTSDLAVRFQPSNRNAAHNTKSAVQIAMEAVHKHIAAESPKESTHILKLKEITENVAADKATKVSPILSPIPKQVTPKRVGRPRKLKRDTSTPVPVPQPIAIEMVNKKTPTPTKLKTPKKIEDIVKGIKESKVRCDLLKNAFGDVPVSENNTRSSPNSSSNTSDVVLPKNISNQPDILMSNKSEEKVVESSNKSEEKVVESSNKSEEKVVGSSNKSEEKVVESNTHQSSLNQNLTTGDVIKTNTVLDCNNQVSPSQKASKLSVIVDKLHTAKSPAKETDVASTKEKTSDLPSNEVVQFTGLKALKDPKGNATETITSKANSELAFIEKTDTANQDTSAHGRSSPTFECLLKSINQRLQSGDDQQDEQDESSISWLEDEKFEIPPSRPKINMIVNSELPPVQTANCLIAPNVSVLDDKPMQEEMSNSSVENKVSSEPLKEQAPESATINSTKVNNTTSVIDIPQQPEPEIQKGNSNSIPPVLSPTCDSVVPAKNIEIEGGSALPDKVESPSSVSSVNLKKKVVKQKVSPPLRKRPGRPRKNLVEAPVDPCIEKTNTASIAGETGAQDKQESIQNDASLKSLDKNQNSKTESTNACENSSLSVPKPTSVCTESPALQTLPTNNAKTDKLTKVENVLNPVSLRNFRNKLKLPVDNSSNNNAKLPLKPITTEFGKNLASKMKEKMRLSLEQDLSKTVAPAEDACSSTCGSETSDANSLASNEDKKPIKKEFEISTDQKIHFCPYCMLEFAYLTNFRRHIKQCKARVQTKEAEPLPGTPSTNLQHLPKKDEVDYSMLNLYRHQSRQTDMLKEDDNASKLIKSYECNICHKIYLNLFNMIQHKLSMHKLGDQSSSTGSSEMTDMNMFSFAEDLTSATPDNAVGNSVFNESQILDDIPKASEAQRSDISDGQSTVQEDGKGNDEASIDETVEMDRSSDVTDKSALSEPVSGEEQPVKRKRGRPVGWRKSAVQEGVESKNVKKDEATEDPLSLKKLGKPVMSSKRIISPEVKAIATQMIIDEVKKLKAEKLIVNSEKFPENKIPKAHSSLGSMPITDYLKAKFRATLSFNASSEEEDFKIASKRSSVKGVAEKLSTSEKDNPETKVAKSALKQLDKSTLDSPTNQNLNNSKRGRGKSARDIQLKTGDLQKRRPGRPPKSLLPSSPVAHSSKSSTSQITRAKKSKPALLMPEFETSSDSDFEEAPVAVANKVNWKHCSFCSEKFTSNLLLTRHIQLAHKTDKLGLNKAELQRKLLKKIAANSPSLITPECGSTDISMKRPESPLKKSPMPWKSDHLVNSKNSDQSAPGKKFDSPNSDKITVLDPETLNVRAIQSKKSESDSSKSEQQSCQPPLTDDAELKQDSSVKPIGSPPKKSPNSKVCAICKKKFTNISLLHHHLQTSHNRKSEPGAIQSGHIGLQGRRSSHSVGFKSVPTSPHKKKDELTFDRSSLSRQCRKPLPALKRKRVKKEPLLQISKKSKL